LTKAYHSSIIVTEVVMQMAGYNLLWTVVGVLLVIALLIWIF
jgi:hypothetical protein